MKLFINLILFIPCICCAQSHCKYKAKKFEDYNHYEFGTEYAGFFLNAINLSSHQVQIESSGYLGGLVNKYQQQISGGLFQFRYALGASAEIQAGAWSLQPYRATVDALFNKQIHAGIKQKIFYHESQSNEWYLSVSGKYLIQSSWHDTVKSMHGTSVALNNTWILSNFLHVSLSFGTVYFYESIQFQPFVSSQILIKEEHSKVGIFVGMTGNQIIDSFGTLGLHISNNVNYMLLLSFGFFDNTVSPTISYTHVFRRRQ